MTRGPRGEAVTIAGRSVAPGARVDVEIPVARLPTQTWVALPVAVVNGRFAGPSLWISAAVHGDEVNGIEIVRSVLGRVEPGRLAGTLYALPIVNVFGFLNRSRYLPDRRDLNRSFPGSPRGSLAARIAHLVMTEIVSRCSHGIDLHTGSDNRTNLPQIRGNLQDAETARIARAFGAPVRLHAKTVDGSLRRAAAERGGCSVLYEGGQALQFDEAAIRTGADGVLRVMAELGMLPRRGTPRPRRGLRADRSHWLRAPRSGILRLRVGAGDRVRKRQIVADISDLFGGDAVAVRAGCHGVVIGHTLNASVNRGEALLHVAEQDGTAAG